MEGPEYCLEDYLGKTSAYDPEPVGKTLSVLRIQTREPGKQRMCGTTLVNDNGTFADVPGLEVIAEGVAPKKLGSLAIARQGRFLYWGFTSDPSGMTEAGRTAFRNAVRHLHARRASRTTPCLSAPRGALGNYLDLAATVEGYEAQGLKHFRGSLDPELLKDWEPTVASGRTWLAENLPYLVTDGVEGSYQVFRVDGNAKRLGTPNHKTESLEAWVRLSREGSPEAGACLARYVDPGIAPKDGDWAVWWARWKGRLVFVDTAGFRFVEDPRLSND